jgi:hypothetical protein
MAGREVEPERGHSCGDLRVPCEATSILLV